MENLSVLRKAQLAQLKIMDAVHNACVKNGITYYIIGGTALGARRHKGFIPWDVDIDIAMPRKDYDRFLELAPIILPSSLHCLHFQNNKNHKTPHAIVCLLNSKLTINSTLFSETGTSEVYIDIMPLDYAPISVTAQKCQAKSIKFVSWLKYRKMSTIYNNDSSITILTKKIFKSLLAIFTWESLNRLQHNIFTKYASIDTQILCSMASGYSYEKQCMNSAIYGKPQLIEFESRLYYAPQMIDKYLTRIYGDYMKLPTKNEQEKLASLIVDIEY